MKQNKEKFVRRLAARLEPARIDLLCLLIEADHSGRPPLPKGMPKNAQEILEISKEMGFDKKKPDVILKGRHLIDIGMKPSPKFGEILADAYQRQLNGEFETPEQAIKLLGL